MRVSQFYDRFHQKSSAYRSVIKDNNFTYWYLLKSLNFVLTQLTGSARVLDIGCGVGTLALYTTKKGFWVKGIDISPRAIKIAHLAQMAVEIANADFIVGSLEDEKNQYELVFCNDLIEHIKDDRLFAKKLASKLKTGGYLLLSTPLRDNWLAKLGFYKKFDKFVGHERRYLAGEVELLFLAQGLEIIELKTVEGPLRSLLFSSKLGILIRFIRGPLVPLFHFVDELFGRIFGWSECILIARKY